MCVFITAVPITNLFAWGDLGLRRVVFQGCGVEVTELSTNKQHALSLRASLSEHPGREGPPAGTLDFGVVIFMENVITRKAPKRIHAGDRRRPRSEVVFRVPPARSYNAGRAGLVDRGLCTRRAVIVL